MSRLKILISCFVFLWISSDLMAEDSITLDEETGNYIIRYEVDGVMKKAVLVPASNVSVRITPKLTTRDADRIVYRYKVKADTKAGLPLATLAMNSKPIIQESLTSPPGWKSLSFPQFNSDLIRIGWMHEEHHHEHTKRGHIVKLFTMESDYLPGFGEIKVRGDTPILAFEGYGPSYEVAKQVDQLMKQEIDSAKIISAVPAITVSRPFDLVETMDAFYRHIVNANNDARLAQHITDKLISDLETVLNSARSGDEDAVKNRLKAILRKTRGNESHDDHKTESDKNHENDHLSELVNDVIGFNVRFILRRLHKHHS